MNNSDIQLPKMISINEAAKASNMSYSSIRQLCIEGKIHYIRVGVNSSHGKYLINQNSLFNFLNGQPEEKESR